MVKTSTCYFPRTTYTCPICGKVFSEYEDAEACSDAHTRIKAVIGFEQYVDTPTVITVEMSDGQQVMYKAVGVVEPENEVEEEI